VDSASLGPLRPVAPKIPAKTMLINRQFLREKDSSFRLEPPANYCSPRWSIPPSKSLCMIIPSQQYHFTLNISKRSGLKMREIINLKDKFAKNHRTK